MGITPKQFQQIQDRLNGARSSAASATPARAAVRSSAPMIVLGIDPALRNTGYGIIAATRTRARAVTFGTISSPAKWERSRCLLNIADSLRKVLREHPAEVCVIESLFYAQNLQTALIMGEARGASLVAVAEAGLEIYEMAPRRVKQAIVGYGGAQKLAVAKMVQRMLALDETPAPDAADALALALTHAQTVGRGLLATPKRL
ncbi:MAG: crossover junction endodeoxyribonuclease RuvC [Verrucomicrobia bacterium]|nr:crossover junction endodeoxyribonuclease RuvC [Verrucomicrobiota bacterium]